MKQIKKAAKLLVLIILIVLASIGIGLAGGIPLSMSKPRKDPEKEDIELVENQEIDSSVAQL